MSTGLNIISILLSGLLLWNNPSYLTVVDQKTECSCEASMSCCTTGHCKMMLSKHSHGTKSKNSNHCNCKQQQPVKQEAVPVIKNILPEQKSGKASNSFGFYHHEILTAFYHQNFKTKILNRKWLKPPNGNTQALLCVFRL